MNGITVGLISHWAERDGLSFKEHGRYKSRKSENFE